MTLAPIDRRAAALATALLLSCTTCPAAETSLTVYSGTSSGALSPLTLRDSAPENLPGYAVIREQRAVELATGRNDIRYSDVPAAIDPTTVSFESITDPTHTRVIEQNYEFDLVSTDKLLDRYIDRDVTIERLQGSEVRSETGRLTSTRGGIVLRDPDGAVHVVPHNDGIRLPALPGGLITRPTLVWRIDAERAGRHDTRVSYQSGGFAWWADYNLQQSEIGGACRIDIGAWVTVVNRSGAGYRDAQLKLVAGDVHRAPTAQPLQFGAQRLMMKAAGAVAGFAEQSLFEYHLYTLGFPTTLPDNSSKQLELFPTVRGVPCERRLVFAPQGAAGGFAPTPFTDRGWTGGTGGSIDVFLDFRNAREGGLGIPLPAGRARVSRQDPHDGSLEFIGVDASAHTPRVARVRLRLGASFDVVGERRQTDFKLDSGRKTMEEEVEITVRNHKDQGETVDVREILGRWSTWEIVQSSLPYEKIDARTVGFVLRPDARSAATVRYRVRYTW